jgi:hypothetical protein
MKKSKIHRLNKGLLGALIACKKSHHLCDGFNTKSRLNNIENIA